MRFLWSDVLWLLLVVPLLIGAYVYALRRRRTSALRYASLMLVREAIGRGQWLRRHLPALLLALGLACALLGAARPTVVSTLPFEYQTIVLAIDVSRSMRAPDIKPTRLGAAQNAVKAFVKELPPTVRVGIVTFAGTASVVQTPTHNRDELIAAVDRFQLQRQTAIGSGLLAALSVLLPDADIAAEVDDFDWGGSPRALGAPPKAAPPIRDFRPLTPGSHASGAIVLLSDGRRTTGPDPLKMARLAAERGVRVHTVGFGTQEGGPVDFDDMTVYMRFDEAALKAIAALTEGEYFHAGSAADLHKVYKNLTTKLVLERSETEVTAFFGAAAALFALVAALLSLLWFHRAH
ncbi:MAG TPA: VWA domain-containing protein [Burkholderiales bacterium]|nr:VWA domain-containing protein [Burkholderiales bacterium]